MLSVGQFSQNSKILNTFLWTHPVPDFMTIWRKKKVNLARFHLSPEQSIAISMPLSTKLTVDTQHHVQIFLNWWKSRVQISLPPSVKHDSLSHFFKELIHGL